MKKKLLTLILVKGRYTIRQYKSSRGFNGPILRGIIGIELIDGELTLWFNDIYKARKVKKLTGWEKGCSDSTLVIPIRNGMVECLHTDERGLAKKAYFGLLVTGNWFQV
jgi:hypothetical protein